MGNAPPSVHRGGLGAGGVGVSPTVKHREKRSAESASTGAPIVKPSGGRAQLSLPRLVS